MVANNDLQGFYFAAVLDGHVGFSSVVNFLRECPEQCKEVISTNLVWRNGH
ncbi:hypothetical protein HanXRQr2_Chr02g0059861 [Helianthus annuus]|uniref:Uncharacterized protein n=1 Tax=Helianthus annuus TaxID=4232 RepID=A0A9K3NZ80_HELAN|nr:hypothetical protein HanXRQr2_Chr02g0059861 [Helianthus annuus]